MRLPHARGPAVAAISKRACRRARSPGRGAGRRAGRDRAGRPRHDPDRRRDRPAARQRRPDPAAVGIGRPPRRHRAQHAGNDRRRLPRRITSYSCKYRCRNFVVQRGMRIAQLVIAPIQHAELVELTSLDPTERASGGFGSTGGLETENLRQSRRNRRSTEFGPGVVYYLRHEPFPATTFPLIHASPLAQRSSCDCRGHRCGLACARTTDLGEDACGPSWFAAAALGACAASTGPLTES